MSGLTTILVVDDERNIRRSLRIILEGEGHKVEEASSGEEALEAADRVALDGVLLDLKLPGIDGLETLQGLRRLDPEVPVVMVSGHGTIQDALEAIRLGAYDFIEKPIHRERLLIALGNALEQSNLTQENRAHRQAAGEDQAILGDSLAIRRVLEAVERVAPTPGRVLITGESGTGKELVARAVHRRSDRAAGPFVKVNCAAIPHELIESELFGHEKGSFTGAVSRRKGRFEQAHRGTLFLDEIGDMSLDAQAKVLRVLETGEVTRIGSDRINHVDVRVLAATNKRLAEEIAAGRFREDLYYRLNVVPIHVPPLRERGADVELLAETFLARFTHEYALPPRRLSPEALAALRRAPWRGNIRELRNLMERLAIMAGPQIEPQDLLLEGPPRATGAGESLEQWFGLPLKVARMAMEKSFLAARLEANGWNISQTARELEVERTNLHKKIRQFGLQRGASPGQESG